LLRCDCCNVLTINTDLVAFIPTRRYTCV